MPLRRKLLPSFTKPVSGQTATCTLDLGKKIHVIWLEIGYDASNANKELNPAATANDVVGEIRLLVNGKVQRRMRARELDALNLLMGSQYGIVNNSETTLGSSGFRQRIAIYLAEPWRKSNAEAALGAWNLAGPNVASASIEVDFNTIDTPYISGYYEWSPPDGGLGAITKWIRTTFGAAGTMQDFNTLEKRDYYHSIHLIPPIGGGWYVKKARLTADGLIVHDTLTYWDNHVLLKNRDMNPPAIGLRYDLVIDADDPVNSALFAQGLSEFTLQVEYSAAASANLIAIIQRTGPPE